jgi:hypothetical protein
MPGTPSGTVGGVEPQPDRGRVVRELVGERDGARLCDAVGHRMGFLWGAGGPAGDEAPAVGLVQINPKDGGRRLSVPPTMHIEMMQMSQLKLPGVKNAKRRPF